MKFFHESKFDFYFWNKHFTELRSIIYLILYLFISIYINLNYMIQQLQDFINSYHIIYVFM